MINVNEEISRVLQDAVNAALSQGRPWQDFWTYYMSPEQRVLFAGQEGFCKLAEERYQEAIS